MPASSEARSDKIAPSKAGVTMIHGSGLLDLVAAVTEQGALYVPFDATIVSIRSRVRTACGTGPGVAKVGKQGDDDFFGLQSHATTDVAGTEFEWTLINTDVAAGDVIIFSGDGGATGTGDCDVTILLAPRSQA